MSLYENGELSWKPASPEENELFGVPDEYLYGAATEEEEYDQFFMDHL